MVLNATMTSITSNEVCQNHGEDPQPLVSTQDFEDDDLEDFINISEQIVRKTRERRWNKKRIRSRSMRSNIMPANMTREEIFETSQIHDEDQYLKAMEHETSYDAEKTECSVVGNNSWHNLMKYFDQDVKVKDDSWDKISANKKTAKGKVASALLSLRNKCSLMATPLKKNKNPAKAIKASNNIQELKKTYESAKESSKSTRKTKVKQMTSLFNNKINSMIKNSTLSPANNKTEAVTAAAKQTTIPDNKSPINKVKLPTFKTKLPSPKPSPFLKRKLPSKTALPDSPLLQPQQIEEQPKSPTYLQAENAFSQLSVRDKILLYNKFVQDMGEQNPKFLKHAEALETKVKKELQGEVVIERQNSVKYLRDSLEAKLTPAKQSTKSPKSSALKANKSPYNSSYKAKEYEDLGCTPKQDAQRDPLHVSSLTVVLKNSPEAQNGEETCKTPRKKKDVTFLEDVSYIEHRVKRTQSMMRPKHWRNETLAPPKKVRRSCHEQLAPKTFFQDAHLERLFYHWLKEKNGKAFDITTNGNKHNIIEIVAQNALDQIVSVQDVKDILDAAINNTKLDSESKTAATLIKNVLKVEQNLEKSVLELEFPFGQADKSDLGLASLGKTSSEDSYQDSNSLDDATETMDKPARKKRLRRCVSLKKDEDEGNQAKIACTDSDSDCKAIKPTFLIKKQMLRPYNKDVTASEVNVSLMRQFNSPNKIKSAYTLTTMSSPSPLTDAEFNQSGLNKTLNKAMSRSWPSILENSLVDYENSLEFSNLSNSKWQQGQQISENLNDQGFETASNGKNSPISLPYKVDKPENFSTPYKTSKQQHFNFKDETGSDQYYTLSPIKTENKPQLAAAEKERTITPNSLNETTLTASETSHFPQNRNTSKFWITSGYFTAGISIYHYEPEHLLLFSNIYSQKSLHWREMNFGIDDQKFCLNSFPALDNCLKQLQTEENCSYYWFSTGDFLVPFKGPQMKTKKIQTFLNYIREFMFESNFIRFGVDAYEFSTVLQQQSNYSLTPMTPLAPWTQLDSSASKTSDLDHSDDSRDLCSYFSSMSFNSDHIFSSSLKSQQTTSTPACQDKPEFVKPTIDIGMSSTLEKVKLFEERFKTQESSTAPRNVFQESKEYISKLKGIIAAIENIGLDNKVKA